MGISWQQLLIILLIVVLVFGTKRLRNIGKDAGTAVRDFRKGLNDADKEETPAQLAANETTDSKSKQTETSHSES